MHQIDFMVANYLDRANRHSHQPSARWMTVRSCAGGAAAGSHNHRIFGQAVLNRTGAEFIARLSGLSANIHSVFANCCYDFAKSVSNFITKKGGGSCMWLGRFAQLVSQL